MANVQQEPDGSFIMTENHCPIANVVESCAEICDAELEIFRSILGSQATVERFEHMPRGDRRCAYRIRNVPAAS
jgi:predicted ArsR family transcriptional regulator